MDTDLANLFAKKFISRPDVKAIQFSNGAWAPHQEFNTASGKFDGPRIAWRRDDLNAHIEGTKTFGHYLLGTDSKCKLFAFDIDLNKAGFLPSQDPWKLDEEPEQVPVADLRAAWLDRSNVARNFMKLQFKEVAHRLLSVISKDLELPCAAAYSGAKGLHVYAFTGTIDAAEARVGAQIVLDSIGDFTPLRGENFFQHNLYPNLSVEVFPKQDSLEGKDLGNLMRLPLGKNLKAQKEPCFFVDMNTPIGVLAPADPVWSLNAKTPWDEA